MKKSLIGISIFIFVSFTAFAGKPISKEPSPLSVVESVEERESWCEKNGYAVVAHYGTLHYWLYDSYKNHEGDISELIYGIVPKWFQSMGYTTNSDYSISSPNLVLADSVKELMSKNNCDVSIAFVEDGNYVVINSYDKESNIYSTYKLYEKEEEIKETVVSKTSYFVQHGWHEDPPYIEPEGFYNEYRDYLKKYEFKTSIWLGDYKIPIWYESPKLNNWRNYLNKTLSKNDLQLFITYINKQIIERGDYPYTDSWIDVMTYHMRANSSTIPHNFKASGNMSAKKFGELLKEVVDSAGYSKKALKIMDFNGNTTRTKVEKKLSEWGMEYCRYFAGDGLEFDEIVYNTFGAGSSIVYDIEWMGLFFDEIIFSYTKDNLLARIEMIPSENTSSRKLKETFDIITNDYPERKTVSSKDKNYPLSVRIKNGQNEDESAVMVLTSPYEFVFYFHGYQLMDFPELDEW